MPPHIPALRGGRAYESLDRTEIVDCRTRQVLATLSQVNAGIIRKDLGRMAAGRAALKKLSTERLLEMCADAGARFLEGDLPLGRETQSASQYVEMLSSSSGLPWVMVRRNMVRINAALANMRTILGGLTRGLSLEVLDRGFGDRLSFCPMSTCLGLVMPSNSPAVNSLWLPAIALKIPVVIKPGREEPWTPYRLIQAFLAAGCPPEAFGFYPTEHDGAGEILRGCGRALLFGGSATTAPYANNPAIHIHGPGYSKILVGEDQIERWPEFIDVMVAAISDNGGRSCINASAIIVPRFAEEIADALARKLGPISPLPMNDDNARLAAFANPKMADYVDNAIEEGLKMPGARDVTALYRDSPRRTVFNGAVYVRPTIVRCDSFDHPLANREFLCPYASVVTVPQTAMFESIGPSLAVTAVTRDPEFIGQLMESPLIERLNIGPISTMTVSWDQPHEGNMFDFLYKRRALEMAK
jgi:hypothetical protein